MDLYCLLTSQLSLSLPSNCSFIFATDLKDQQSFMVHSFCTHSVIYPPRLFCIQHSENNHIYFSNSTSSNSFSVLPVEASILLSQTSPFSLPPPVQALSKRFLSFASSQSIIHSKEAVSCTQVVVLIEIPRYDL